MNREGKIFGLNHFPLMNDLHSISAYMSCPYKKLLRNSTCPESCEVSYEFDKSLIKILHATLNSLKQIISKPFFCFEIAQECTPPQEI